MINNSILNMENQRKYISIYNIFRVILILSLFLSLINKCFADDEDSKKCVVYRNGKLMYNPDNPKIHCDTLQLLDNYWNGTDVNVPNQNKKPEEFAAILTEREIISNGRTVCKNPSATNAKFTAKDAIEGETINGTCNVGYTGTVSATCNKNGSWTINNKCLGSCTNLSNMYKDSGFSNPTKSVTDSEYIYSKCGNGYDGYKKYTCSNGRIKELISTCTLSMDYCPRLSKENGTITYTNEGALNSKATLKCNVGYEIIGGSTTTKCSSKNETNGDWNTTLGNCTPKTCSNPTTQANANAFTKTSLKYNEAAITATCKTGYNGSISATCDESGSWKYTGNCTIVRCPTTLTIDNGSYPTISTANNSYNTTISGTCNTGYTGTITATCNASGVWVKSGSCTLASGCWIGNAGTIAFSTFTPINLKTKVWGVNGNGGENASGCSRGAGSGGSGGYVGGKYDKTNINKLTISSKAGGAGGGQVAAGNGNLYRGGAGGAGGAAYGVYDNTNGIYVAVAGGGGGGSGTSGYGCKGSSGQCGGGAFGGNAGGAGNTGCDKNGENCTGYAQPNGTESFTDGGSGSNGNNSHQVRGGSGGGGGAGYAGGSGGSGGRSVKASCSPKASGGGGGAGGTSFSRNLTDAINTVKSTSSSGYHVVICWGNNTKCDDYNSTPGNPGSTDDCKTGDVNL